MCSIIGSFSKTKFKELVTLNQSRGSFSYSFMVFDTVKNNIVSLNQDFGEFPQIILDSAEEGMYYIGHTQAPTGGLIKDLNRIHPAMRNNEFLFHNGIIKEKDVKRLQNEIETTEGWDSKLMLIEIQNTSLLDTLNSIDGSFACVYFDSESVRIFRSSAGILFVDKDLNISSTKFDNSERIDKDTVFKLNFTDKLTMFENTFTSKSSPYFY